MKLNFKEDGTFSGTNKDEDGTADLKGVYDLRTGAMRWTETLGTRVTFVQGALNWQQQPPTITGRYESSEGVQGTLSVNALGGAGFPGMPGQAMAGTGQNIGFQGQQAGFPVQQGVVVAPGYAGGQPAGAPANRPLLVFGGPPQYIR
mmetsp:Transcript_25425/g.55931  ORF Transcript_25425/g.55931 Transcript_25425/m.55931 type:complete len:147 (-) Transcript_25425:167-607(-)